ncbi:14164_t:CDS:1, partial [Cetraspora pellucida]
MTKIKTLTKYYKILEITKNTNEKEIKRAYKKLALKWHPDKNINSIKIAEEKFKEINEAYEILIKHKQENNKKTKEKNIKKEYNANLKKQQNKEKQRKKREENIQKKRQEEIKRQAEERIKMKETIKCHCDKDAKKYQAKTKTNLDRIFYICIICDFFVWQDEYQNIIK